MAIPGKPPIDTSKHGIAIEFPDDHSINGIRIKLDGLTPEQIHIAAWHLERTADAYADARLTAMQEAPKGIDTTGGRGDLTPAELAAIARDPRGGIRQ